MAMQTPASSSCAVSVIMPMYNTEKYLVESLDSVLMQTFQDFEVILVNDCSTDNSRQVAESCLEKFGGRLKIYDNVKNSKAAATRNRGLLLSRGEYIFFLDSDDLLMLNALEKMYTLAKKYDADVVSLGGFYQMNERATEIVGMENKNHRIFKDIKDDIIIDDDMFWRLKRPLSYRFYSVPWLRLFRRDFLIGNGIFFPENISACEDVVWKHGFLLLAKRIIHIKDIFNLYRMSDDSLTRKKRSNPEFIRYRMHTVFYGMKWIDEVMDKVDFFKENPEYRYEVLKDFVDNMVWRLLLTARKRKWPRSMVYNLIKQEFGEEFGEQDVLLSALCSLASNYRRTIEDDEARIAELKKLLKKRKK